MDLDRDEESLAGDTKGSRCCFCGKSIVTNAVEPLQLIVLEYETWAASRQRLEQSLFAHVDCLGSCLHRSVPFLMRAERHRDDADDVDDA